MSLAGGPRWPVPLPTDPRKADDALVALARQGEAWAFEALYTKYESPIHGYLYKMLVIGCAPESGRVLAEEAQQDAADLTQTVFLRAWMALPKAREDTKFAPWIHRIALHAYLDLFRKRRGLDWVPWARFEHYHAPYCVDETVNVEREALQYSTAEDVQLVLEKLFPRHRMMLVLREFQHLTYDEIAEVMDTTRKSVKATLFRARQAFAAVVRHDADLRERFASYGYVTAQQQEHTR